MESQLLNEYCQLERIIAENDNTGDLFCKWKCLPYSECTWEDKALITRRFPQLFEHYTSFYANRKITQWPTSRGAWPKIRSVRSNTRRDKILLPSQPSYIGGTNAAGDPLELRSYQLAGLNFLHRSWLNSRSLVLADEMGLGKTVEIVTFLSVLYHEHSLSGPYLIVIPLSTVVGWQREFAIWAPELYAVTYLGDAQSRQTIREYEWWHPDRRHLKFNVLITTYEIVLRDKSFLSSVDWAALIVDEAHRLKNDDSLLYRTLQPSTFPTDFRILVTGTPLQNTLRELWAILHFANPEDFDDWSAFEDRCAAAQRGGANSLSGLHQELQPFILRRTKKVVEKELPAKIERILRVPMSQRQKQIYQWLLARNYTELTKSTSGGTFSGSLINVVMELKKCCNHCELIMKPSEDSDRGANVSDPSFHEASQVSPRLASLLRGSGKLILLDKLLHRLKAGGHRVLIFSQMVRMLDVLGDYLRLRHFPYQRLDGQTSAVQRRQSLDHFNAPGSTDFCFLLSTRAGGLGLNLNTADTVVIYDSDWNPQNDLQAAARAHRIGQKNQVSVYRLVTQFSVEEHILEQCKKKMVLDHLVIQRMDASGRTVLSGGARSNTSGGTSAFTADELSALLKFGAKELFHKKDEHDTESNNTSDGRQVLHEQNHDNETEPVVDVDEILQSAEAESSNSKETEKEDSVLPHEEFLAQVYFKKFILFKQICFTFQFRVITLSNLNQDDGIQIPDDDVAVKKTRLNDDNPEEDWDEIMPAHIRDRVLDVYDKKFALETEDEESAPVDTQLEKPGVKGSDASSDEVEVDDEEEEEEEEEDERRSRRKTKGSSTRFMGFTQAELKRLVRSLHHFADPMSRLDAISSDARLEDKSSRAIGQVTQMILASAQEGVANAELEQQNQQNQAVVKSNARNNTLVKVGPINVNATKLVNTLNFLQPLVNVDRLVAKIDDKTFKPPRWASKLPLLKSIGGQEDAENNQPQWSAEDDRNLLKGVAEYGLGAWEQLRMDTDLKLKKKILPQHGGRPNAQDLQKRFDFLMKKLCVDTVPKVQRQTSVQKQTTTKKNAAPKQRRPNEDKAKSKPTVKNENSNSGESHDHVSGETSSDEDSEMFDRCRRLLKPMKQSLIRMQEIHQKQEKKKGEVEEGEVTSGDSRPQSRYDSSSNNFDEDLVVVGNFIADCSEKSEDPKLLKKHLWEFVARFTTISARQLYKTYKKACSKRNNSSSRNKDDKGKSESNRHQDPKFLSASGHERQNNQAAKSSSSTIPVIARSNSGGTHHHHHSHHHHHHHQPHHSNNSHHSNHHALTNNSSSSFQSPLALDSDSARNT